VPLLEEVLDAVGQTPVVVEIKVKGHTKEICDIVAKYPHLEVMFASFKRGVIKECRELRPDVPALVGRRGAHPLEIVEIAKVENATGIDLNYRLLNPLTYWLCKRANLQIMAYTVNSNLIGQLIQRFYPDVWICTNYPGKFIQGENHARRIRSQRRTN
jgi:glycerophosphoryl diester phosphodiesterase